MAGDDRYRIDILDAALDLIEWLLMADGRPQSASEIARQLGVNRTRVFRILKNLERRGYVETDPQTRGYRLGLKFVEIGGRLRESLDLRRVAEPILMDLAQHTGETVHLLALFGRAAIRLDRYQGEHLLQVAAPIGEVLPLYIGASPKILLAFMPEEQRERIIQETKFTPFTRNTITNQDVLRRTLDEIRRQGYCVEEEDFELGVCSVGAPVRDHRGSVVAGVTVTLPSTRFGRERRAELIRAVIDAAGRVSARLGWTASPPG